MDKEQNFLTSLKTYPLDQVSLRRVFLIMLRFHYSDAANFGAMEKTLAKYTYVKSAPELSGVDIQLVDAIPFSPESVYPCITISVGDMKLRREVISDMSAADGHRGLSAASRLDVDHYSENADESLTLAGATCAYFTGFAEVLRDRMMLMRFQPNGTQGPEYISDKKISALQLYRSRFSAEIHYDYSWCLNYESHLIREINIQTASQFDDV
jgi:hypothetical protein